MSDEGTATKISEAEWRVMEVLWDSGELAPAQIIKRLETTTDWNHRTIRSLLSRLVAKGVASRSKESGANLYRAEVSREACIRQETESFVNRVFRSDGSPRSAGASAMGQVIESFFGGSVEDALAAHLGRGERLDPEELEGLSALIEEAKNKGN